MPIRTSRLRGDEQSGVVRVAEGKWKPLAIKELPGSQVYLTLVAAANACPPSSPSLQLWSLWHFLWVYLAVFLMLSLSVFLTVSLAECLSDCVPHSVSGSVFSGVDTS